MPHSPDFEEEVTHADQDMDLKDEMELQIALADPRLVDDDVLEKAGFKPEEIKVWQEEREFHYSMLQAGYRGGGEQPPQGHCPGNGRPH